MGDSSLWQVSGAAGRHSIASSEQNGKEGNINKCTSMGNHGTGQQPVGPAGAQLLYEDGLSCCLALRAGIVAMRSRQMSVLLGNEITWTKERCGPSRDRPKPAEVRTCDQTPEHGTDV